MWGWLFLGVKLGFWGIGDVLGCIDGIMSCLVVVVVVTIVVNSCLEDRSIEDGGWSRDVGGV